MNQLSENIKALTHFLEYNEFLLIEVLSSDKRYNHRTNIYLKYSEIMQHYAFSILILLKHGQSHSARSLLRNLYEVWVNINYLFLTRDHTNLVQLVYNAESNLLKHNEDLYSFVQSNTEHSSMLPQKDYQEIKKVRNYEISELRKYGHSLENLPNLRERAKAIDRKHGNKVFEKLYFNWYKASSLTTHSSVILLNSMRQLDDYQFIDGDQHDLEGISAITLCFIYENMELMNKRLKLGKDLGIFNDDWIRICGQSALDLGIERITTEELAAQ